MKFNDIQNAVWFFFRSYVEFLTWFVKFEDNIAEICWNWHSHVVLLKRSNYGQLSLINFVAYRFSPAEWGSDFGNFKTNWARSGLRKSFRTRRKLLFFSSIVSCTQSSSERRPDSARFFEDLIMKLRFARAMNTKFNAELLSLEQWSFFRKRSFFYRCAPKKARATCTEYVCCIL